MKHPQQNSYFSRVTIELTFTADHIKPYPYQKQMIQFF